MESWWEVAVWYPSLELCDDLEGWEILMNYSTVFFLTHTYAIFNVQDVCVVAMFITFCRADEWMIYPR